MAEILSTISIASFVLAGVFFILSILLWFKFKIPKIIGDLTGRTAKASIAKMRESNEKSGAKFYKPSSDNSERGKLTETASGFNESKIETAKLDINDNQFETGILLENKADKGKSSPDTDILDDGTALLNSNETSKQAKAKERMNITILDEIVIIHTDEVIE